MGSGSRRLPPPGNRDEPLPDGCAGVGVHGTDAPDGPVVRRSDLRPRDLRHGDLAPGPPARRDGDRRAGRAGRRHGHAGVGGHGRQARQPGPRLQAAAPERALLGQDHVAATVNTLVLAYVGASLPVLLIFSIGETLLRRGYLEAVSEQIVAMLVGSIGLTSPSGHDGGRSRAGDTNQPRKAGARATSRASH